MIAVSEALTLGFDAPSGEQLRFEWNAEDLEGSGREPGDAPAWSLSGELDWDEVERVRVLSARLDDGRLLAIAALRPAGAPGHGTELVTGAVGEPGSFSALDEALLSTEYGADRLPRRIGLELYPDADGIAMRIAGDVSAVESSVAGGVKRMSATLTLRGAGGGNGSLDLLERA